MKAIQFLLATSPLVAASDFQLDFNSHLNFAFGQASVDEAELATYGHDPNDEFTLQGLELNASARYGDYLAGFVCFNTFLDDDDKIDGEFEEAFAKLQNLPRGFELRAGRMLNRVSTQNNQHLHSWHFTDANLITTRFLGEEGLVTNSVEVGYKLPFAQHAMLSIAFGDAVAHDHDHGHHDEDHDDDDHDDDHDEGIEGEDTLLIDDIIAIRLAGQYNHTDFHQFSYGANFIYGKNGFRKNGSIYGADLTYQWRENGLDPGGKHLRATIEPVYRDFDYTNSDENHPGSASEWGLHTGLGWGFREQWELGLRYGYLEGINAPIENLSERHRSTVALTRALSYNDYLGGHVRLQYNHDWREGYGHEDAVWLQFQIDFGTGGEVR